MDTSDTNERKTCVIALTGRLPVRVIESEWPLIALVARPSWNSHFRSGATRVVDRTLYARRHADGRVLVSGTHDYKTSVYGEDDRMYRRGRLLDASADLAEAIHAVASELAKASGDDHWAEMAHDCLASLPAEEI